VIGDALKDVVQRAFQIKSVKLRRTGERTDGRRAE
jgi:hypothetical protein